MGTEEVEVREHDLSEKVSVDDKGRKQQQEQAVKNQKRKRKEIAPYGNYRNYYGYRIGQSFDEDPRLKAFRKEWFEGKDCLDIGCNSGIIDIDRIEDALWNLRRVGKKKIASKVHMNAPKFVATETSDGIEDSVTNLHTEDRQYTVRDCSSSEERDLSDVVCFRQENFVKSHHTPQMQFYDTIICLSVTKWIHLNWGDDGLMTFFSKIWRLLHPGGIFVLEPQPWSSYKSNRLVSETTQINYHNIMFHPECFQELLLDKVYFLLQSLDGFHMYTICCCRLDLEGWKTLLPVCQVAKKDLTDQFWCSTNNPHEHQAGDQNINL